MLGERSIELVDCPECGFPAFVEHRFSVRSTDGPVPHVVTMCAQLHRLCTPDPLAVVQPRVPPLSAPAMEDPPVPESTPSSSASGPQGPWEETTAHDAGTP